MASKISEPRPGRLKMISTNTAPPISSPMPTPRMATVGMQASFSAYFIDHAAFRLAIGAAVRMYGSPSTSSSEERTSRAM